MLTAVVDEIGALLVTVEPVVFLEEEPHDLPGVEPDDFFVPADFLPLFGVPDPDFLAAGVPDFLFKPVFFVRDFLGVEPGHCTFWLMELDVGVFEPASELETELLALKIEFWGEHF